MFMRMVYDEKLAQAAYLIGCQRSGEAVVIDPQRDVDRYIDLAASKGLRIVATAETHIHADFVSGSRELSERVGAKVYVSGEGGPDWKYTWITGGEHDYQLLHDGESFWIGNIEFEAVHTPGHTPEHMVLLVTDHGGGADEPIGILTGDFLFVGDLGRPDLLETAAGMQGQMEPSARQLHRSLERLADLPGFVQVWPAHGAGSACGKALGAVPTSTLGYERRFNDAMRHAESEQGFVDFILAGQPEPPVYFATMKRVNKQGPLVLGGVPTPPRVSAADLAKIDTSLAAVIDTRKWDAFRAAHLPGALYIPLNASFNTDAGSLVGETEPMYLVVEEARLDEAVRDLIRIGLDEIRGWCTPADLESHLSSGGASATIDEMGVDEARELIEGGGASVLDVRRATEFEAGHIPGATNIAHTRLATRMDEVPAGGRLIVNCRSGGRSARASAYLKRAGMAVINLRGGYRAWGSAETPVNS